MSLGNLTQGYFNSPPINQKTPELRQDVVFTLPSYSPSRWALLNLIPLNQAERSPNRADSASGRNDSHCRHLPETPVLFQEVFRRARP